MRRIFLVIVCLFFIFSCSPRLSNQDSTGETVVCFGDSITEGVGASPGQDYPSLLQTMIDFPVINAGVAGETTKDGLKRIDSVFKHNPKLVIVEFGGNDFLKKVPISETFENLEKIVEKIHQKGAMAAIASVRIGLMKDRYENGYKEIAEKHKALLIPNVMRDVMFNYKLKSDHIHPNAKGYVVIAELIYKRIKPLLEK